MNFKAIENPRYLVIREGKFFGLQRDDYHALPLKLAVEKDLARMKAFSSTFEQKIKRQDRWQ